MEFIKNILSWWNSKRLNQIDAFIKNPFEVQKQQLISLIRRAENTDFGIKYGFSSIKTKQDFAKHVPLHDYDSLKPYITRLREGEQNVLWPTTVRWFAKSSGTTSDKSKFIPVSKEALKDCHFRGGKDVLAFYIQNNPDTKIFSGKSLTLGGSRKINNHNDNSYVGDLSAILIQNMPFWANFIRTPEKEIALLDEWEQKLEKITQLTIKENVTSLVGVPSWNLVLLKHILSQTGKQNILEIWPELQLFIHGGVSFIPYIEQYRKLIPSENMQYLETYNASEGFFAIQNERGRDDMLLMLDYGIFYEFIPLNQIHKQIPDVLSVDDIIENEQYALVITTNGGLWRYTLGDTVKITSKFPLKIKISGRTKHYINVFGEELIIDNAENALEQACSKNKALIRDYTAGPVYMSTNEKGSHEWLIEFEKEPGDMNQFIIDLDIALKSLNSDYEAKRYKDITLRMPEVIVIKPGTFFKWLKEKDKLGGQNKVPRLANDRKYIEEIIQIHQQL